MNTRTALALCAVVLMCIFPRMASAGLIVTFEEVGADVVATLSGSFAALPTPANNANAILRNRVAGGLPYFDATDQPSGTSVNLNDYPFVPLNSFPDFGTSSTIINADTSTANTSVFLNVARVSLVPSYVPGTSFSGALTWTGQSFASLNLTPGSYVGTLSNAETVTFNIGSGPAPVPEPGTWAAAALLAGGAAFMRWRKRRSA
jgi:hypothetical protein